MLIVESVYFYFFSFRINELTKDSETFSTAADGLKMFKSFSLTIGFPTVFPEDLKFYPVGIFNLLAFP